MILTFFSEFHMKAILTLLAVDRSTPGRTDQDSFSPQTQMEILVSNFPDTSVFQDELGNFLPVHVWHGISTDDDGVVLDISWDPRTSRWFNEFHGSQSEPIIQGGGSVDFQWIPATVEKFTASNLQLIGTIDTYVLPRCLLHLQLDYNELYGSFALKGLPQSVAFIDLQSNDFSGNLNFADMPRGVESFGVRQNRFSGTLKFADLPEDIEYLDLGLNSFIGRIDTMHFSRHLVFFGYEGNSFTSEGEAGQPVVREKNPETIDIHNIMGTL